MRMAEASTVKTIVLNLKILVLDFLVKYFEECENLSMSEAQALVILPT